MQSYGRFPAWALGFVLIAFVGLGFVANHVLAWRQSFVMLTVEESSTKALIAWPLLAERLPGVFLDAQSQTVYTEGKPKICGAALGLFYSATSQGVEFGEAMTFSRIGRTTLRLTAPLSMVIDSLQGESVEAVDNSARVLLGDLRIERTLKDGTVWLRYDGRKFALGPGEAWAQLLILEPDGVRRVDEENWEEEFRDGMRSDYPITRLAIANRGLWPKAGVKAGTRQ